MKHFRIRKEVHSKDDHFGMKAPDGFLLFTARGLVDLRKTLRVLTPPGYRIRSVAWFGKQFKSGGSLELRNIFGHPSYYIDCRKTPMQVINTHPITYKPESSSRFTHEVKVTIDEPQKFQFK